MTFGFCQETNVFDWNSPVYYEARAYMYALDREGDCGLIIQNKTLNRETIDSNGIEIDVNRLNKILEITVNTFDSLHPDEGTFYTFSPHHGIVLFNENNEPVAHISICFISGRINFFPENNEFQRGINLFANLFNDLNYPVYSRPEFYYGYSRQFKSEIDTTERVLLLNEVEEKPEFNYNNLSLNEYLKEYLWFRISDSSDYDRKISFSFIVEKTGEITFPKILCSKMDLEEKRLLIALNVMPNWTSGKNEECNVRTLITKSVYLKK